MGKADQINSFGVLTSLAHAIRIHACAAVAGDFASVREICDVLDKHDSRVFKRIGACIVALNATAATSIVRSMLLDEELFYASWLVTEFNLLSEKGYRELVANERVRYLAMLARMPPYVAGLPEEDKTDAFERWQLARLRRIADLLPPAWKERHRTLDEKHAIALSEIEAVRNGRAIHHSSVPSDAVAQMEMDQLVDFVKSWKPESEASSSDLDLGYALSHRISAAPQQFVEQTEVLRQLDLKSIWWFFHALSQAVREQRPFEWSHVISFAREVYTAASQPALHGSGAKAKPDWTRRAVVQLIDDGLRADQARIPDLLMHDTLGLLEMAALDSDPTQSEDLSRSRPGRAVDAAINCSRGIAFDALYHFIERFKADDANSEDFWPKIKSIVDNYIRDESSHRLAVHAMIGQIFPLLWQWDRDWGLAIMTAIFPQTEEKRLFFGAAWEGYVGTWRPGVDLFNSLRFAYSLASQNLPNMFSGAKDEPLYAATRTVQHIISEYGRSTVELHDDECLLRMLIAGASPQLRRTAIQIAGTYWSGADVASPNGERFAKRMQEFYGWRFDQCKKLGSREIAIEEVWAIGDWPRDGFANAGWWLDQLVSVLATWNAIPRHASFSDYLPMCATSHPEKVLTIIEALVDAERPEWSMISMRGDIKDALKSVLDVDRKKYFGRIKTIVNRFSTTAVTGFDDLIQGSDDSSNPGAA